MPVDEAKMPLRIVLLGNGGKPEVVAEAGRLAGALREVEGVALVGVDLGDDTDLSGLKADVAVVLGGDGTVLHAARRDGDNAHAGPGDQPRPAPRIPFAELTPGIKFLRPIGSTSSGRARARSIV